jgi:hypothetical protein
MPDQTDIDNIKSEIESLEVNYKNEIDNVKRSEQLLEDSKNTYNHYLFYTIGISAGVLYLSTLLYKSFNKK